jgi:deazaflavin-dependent oxidoreductase (nitroreductase family)
MWYNKIMIALLRSPLHGMLGGSMMLITFTGRKSGKTFTTPVNYLIVQDESGEYLLTTSQRDRTWWRNLRGGAPVTLRLRGRDVSARAEAIEDELRVTAELLTYLQKQPKMSRYYEVGLDDNGQPKPQDIARIAKTRLVICTRLA